MLLPTETVQNIASFLPGHDLIALRSTCKLLETQLRGIFLWKFFGVRHVWLNEQSLLNLVEFSKVTHLAQETTTILIRADPTGAINQNISENPTLISYVQMIEIYGRVNASEMRQWKLVDSGHFTDLLSQALRGFSNLSSLKFEGGEEDASYGLRDKLYRVLATDWIGIMTPRHVIRLLWESAKLRKFQYGQPYVTDAPARAKECRPLASRSRRVISRASMMKTLRDRVCAVN